MTRVLSLLLAVCILSGAAWAQTLSPHDFTERFAGALGAASPLATVAVAQDLQLKVRRSDGSSSQVNLANVYNEYRGSPDRFNDLIEIFAKALKEPIPAKLQREQIVPMIKDRAWLEEIAPIFKARGAEPLFDPFTGELVIVYAEDSQTRARYLNSRDDVGDHASLRALAINNLKRILPKIEMHQIGNAFAAMSAGGNYEPSLLLFDDIWSGGQIKVDGDIVVAIPLRDTLLVTGSKNRKGLKAMRASVAKLADGPYRLTDRLFVYRGGRFVKFGRN
jgi:uncharacterized protein YtpQ (UPF0354 family)